MNSVKTIIVLLGAVGGGLSKPSNNFSEGISTPKNELALNWAWPDEYIKKKNENLMQLTEPTLPPKYDPCAEHDPKPDFESGRRISEAKCQEYIWNEKKQYIIQKRANECYESTRDPNEKVHQTATLIGGENTKPAEFPHMGAIGWKSSTGWIFMCGSTLVSPKFTVTAAHCSQTTAADTSVTNTYPEIVRFGNKNIAHETVRDENGITHIFIDVGDNVPVDKHILKFMKHPNYKSPMKYYDIAIIELAEAVTYTPTIQPACIWTKDDTSELGTNATLTGWGVTELNSRKLSGELQAADVNIIDSGLCDSLLNEYHNRLWSGVKDQICAGKLEGGVDACQGDSGGPLQIRIKLDFPSDRKFYNFIGVTSFGAVKCALPNIPGLYTKVSSFIDWIEQIVWQ